MNTIALKSNPQRAHKKDKHASRFFFQLGDASFKVYFFSILLAFCLLFAWILMMYGGRD